MIKLHKIFLIHYMNKKTPCTFLYNTMLKIEIEGISFLYKKLSIFFDKES